MNLASLSSASVSAATARPSAVKVGELDARFPRRDEALYVEPTGASSAYPTMDDALGGAAYLAEQSGGAVAVSRQGAGFVANSLLQPVWTREGIGRENAHSLTPADVEVLEADGDRPRVAFAKMSYDGYGGVGRDDRTGRLTINAGSGIDAVVGRDWAYLDGRLQSVTPTYPPAPAPTDPEPAPPVDPTQPSDPAPCRTLVEDVTEGLRLAQEAARIIGTVPQDDRGDESTKDVRIKAYKTNMAAQARLEQQFAANNSEGVLSTLRSADARLEDANWQLAKKPSPDGRFTGVDVPGALRDTSAAVDLLTGLLEDVTAAPSA